ncbi:hypothetical protein L226DRAFT_536467 [Lentinus tigrinus ALCF2SS1-7]|uniref:Uncharacterized protein n=1 Tax=Lentinus tigrinus ALCF2SS1-6 TaxID=1328759 RepID=A0A5C2SCA4_9APHY|nr:hypothetical protein L227DRAFT_576608 [Lentinus tigrinus ALCF2SS1-6]RPD73351.1 hypothetical protein L226DRAFT_536467 [Lentinus tigrinus ALCF2SS1-7]
MSIGFPGLLDNQSLWMFHRFAGGSSANRVWPELIVQSSRFSRSCYGCGVATGWSLCYCSRARQGNYCNVAPSLRLVQEDIRLSS